MATIQISESGMITKNTIEFTRDEVQLIRNAFCDIYKMAYINDVKLIGVQKAINMLETKLEYDELSTF